MKTCLIISCRASWGSGHHCRSEMSVFVVAARLNMRIRFLVRSHGNEKAKRKPLARVDLHDSLAKPTRTVEHATAVCKTKLSPTERARSRVTNVCKEQAITVSCSRPQPPMCCDVSMPRNCLGFLMRAVGSVRGHGNRPCLQLETYPFVHLSVRISECLTSGS